MQLKISKEPNILSISATHDASVAIYRGNQLVLNLELEKYQEKKEQVDTQKILLSTVSTKQE